MPQVFSPLAHLASGYLRWKVPLRGVSCHRASGGCPGRASCLGGWELGADCGFVGVLRRATASVAPRELVHGPLGGQNGLAMLLSFKKPPQGPPYSKQPLPICLRALKSHPRPLARRAGRWRQLPVRSSRPTASFVAARRVTAENSGLAPGRPNRAKSPLARARPRSNRGARPPKAR